MVKPLIDKGMLRGFGNYTAVAGVLLIILGGVGIALPFVMSVFTTAVIGGGLLLAGLFWVYHSFQSGSRHLIDWLKPFLLVVAGGLLLAYPLPGIASVGLLIAFYLLIDAFSSFAIAHSLHPAQGWGMMAINGVASLVLATMFLVGWPEATLWLVGLFIGISMLFDGWALIFIWWALRGGTSRKET